ncbi:Kinetochore Mis14 [Kalmanozyma brasiliensis GHG001]|uniref:Permease of the major facilitator superfamily n=1 Tax=Kalmanozyma brasiliensis (strain GHG001) TaxID=1365824 RepID=V5E4Q0_KALBG|nr:Kinetochore Mis14 [Kalmanozyma brasiliensis GHG001]EST05171.1 Kinetochore Mis14 [Kalmanozyma brasiliensis GHG001]
MSGHFPRLNLDRPADLDHVLHVINDHAHKVAQMEFGSELERDKALKALVDKMIKRLTGATKAKIERNLLYNGMSPGEYSRHSKGVEPFDEDLSRRLQVLNDQSNTLTTEVIAFRKALPARRAEAMEKRAAVIRALEAKTEEQRRAAEEEHALRLREQSKPINIDLKRKAEVADTLKHSVVDITSLQVSILEQATAANEQAKLVKRLRTMPL